jgi:competence protein ComEA
VSDLDRPRLALYVALGLAVCFLGARYLRTQVVGPAGGGGTSAGATAPGSQVDGAGTTAGGGGAGAASGGAGADGASGAAAGGGTTPTVQIDRSDGGRVTVHVAGAVRRPGLYVLPAGSRVNDALRRAGGPARRADLAAINLAAKLEDGRQVLVPQRVAVPGAGGGASGGSAAAPAGGGAAVAGSGGGVGAVGGATGAPAAPVNLNTATLEQLDTLDGVGPGIAQRILDYRQQHGGFGRVEELGEVPGIGAKRLATLTPLVTV